MWFFSSYANSVRSCGSLEATQTQSECGSSAATQTQSESTKVRTEDYKIYGLIGGQNQSLGALFYVEAELLAQI